LETGKKILERGFKYIIFFLKGRNKGRKRCVKSFKKLGLTILKIYDKTVVCHNGCRPTKIPRR
jgi:ribosomal protein S11